VQQAENRISIDIGPVVVPPPAKGAELLLQHKKSQPVPAQIDSIVKLELDGSAMDLEPF
jgi:hypothetical protein